MLVIKIFEEVIRRYLRLGSGQFLKDFRRDYNLKKTLAHRKAVLARKEKDQERQMKVQIKAIEGDRKPFEAFVTPASGSVDQSNPRKRYD